MCSSGLPVIGSDLGGRHGRISKFRLSQPTIDQHAQHPNADRIRLSTSAPYQPVSEPADGYALGPQKRWADGEELYADWAPDDPLRYYWRSLDLSTQTCQP